jgi:chromosome segregation protein
VLRRASGAIFLSSAETPSGPLRRRAELAELVQDAERGQEALKTAESELQSTSARLVDLEKRLGDAAAASEVAREEDRQGSASREDAVRLAANLAREWKDSETQAGRIRERLTAAEKRLAEVDAGLVQGDLARGRLDGELEAARALLGELEAELESAREQRVHWQVREAHVAGGLRSAEERLERAGRTRAEAEAAAETLRQELEQLETDTAAIITQQGEWREALAECRTAVAELEAAAAEAETGLTAAESGLAEAERTVAEARRALEAANEESHSLQVRLTESAGARRSIVERVELEWRKPFEQLMETATMLDLDLETLEAESARVIATLESIGPVNPLAVEEHAEEVKRLEFLTSQRDDLVGARQALIQAIREIDGTARTMFLETFTAVQANFLKVFTTLFGGGECELRLANPDDPLESEIDIHAAPRGKRTQRIHLLSSGERTLVAVSLLFSIYLTKPSPFCLMDEVDAPLDDANVGRFTRLLDEFKTGTQFLVITHNPRTMQSADAVYGVTMQEPGVSTIVGVRLGEREHA